MQSASRQAVKSCSEAVGLRIVQARSGGRTCRGKKGCRVSRVDFAHGGAKSITRVATLRRLGFRVVSRQTKIYRNRAFRQAVMERPTAKVVVLSRVGGLHHRYE